MFNEIRKEIEWCGRKLTLSTGKVARQADGAVMVTYGQTAVLCAATFAKKANPGVDFFPLTVHYIEKAYAAGKIPGGFFKREGKPAEREVLISRLIDRPIRPLFPSNYYNETQVICTVLSHDGENDSDILAMIGASAALAISGAPFESVVGGIKVAYKDGEYIFNPQLPDLEGTELDLVVGGTKDSVLMVESEAKELSESIMLEAVRQGHEQMQPVIKLIEELKVEAGKPAFEVEVPDHSALASKIKELAEAELRTAYQIRQKQERVEKVNDTKTKTKESLQESLSEEEYDDLVVSSLLKKLEMEIVRGDILKTGERIDGRTVTDIRDIRCEMEFLPRTHGSALFTRGETQALVVSTLGTTQDEQIIDDLEGDRKQHFLLHYNFPAYSVGESSPLRPPGRREVGHGKLAWRALNPVLPSREEFPYSIRVVSEITESNGSSSMATVCGGALAMIDAGVPLKAPVAGIAMGLIKEGDQYAVLSDILGDEDHLGDMDFKVAGTEQGITSLQMDIKINGITTEIMDKALGQAKDGRLHILGIMKEALPAEAKLSTHAPRIHSLTVPTDKIREIIGAGGKVIREITEVSGCKIDIDDTGKVNVFASPEADLDKAMEMIGDIVNEPEVGTVYEGPITKVADFGVFVKFMGAREGLVHISEIANERVNTIQDYCNEGDVVKVLLLGVDRGKFRLTMRRVNQETGEVTDTGEDDRQERRGGGNRDRGDRGDRNNRGKRDRNNRGDRGPRQEKNQDDTAPNVSNDVEEPAAPQEEAAPPKKKRRRFF